MKNTSFSLTQSLSINYLAECLSKIFSIELSAIDIWKNEGLIQESANAKLSVMYSEYKIGLPMKIDIFFAEGYSSSIQTVDFFKRLSTCLYIDVFFLEQDNWGILYRENGEFTKVACNIKIINNEETLSIIIPR